MSGVELGSSGKSLSIVIRMIANYILLGVFGPSPVEVVVQDEIELGAARLRAYDVEEEVQREVEHLEHVEALGDRDLRQASVVGHG